MLPFLAILTPPLRGREGEPIAHIGDEHGPATVDLGAALPTPKTFEDGLDAEEAALGILLAVDQCVVGAGPQVVAEAPDFLVESWRVNELDVPVGVVFDGSQRLVDLADTFLDVRR